MPIGVERLRIGIAWIGILLFVAIGIGLRREHLDEPLWLDERHSEWTVAASWSELPARAALGNQSALPFVPIRLAVALFGDSPTVLRSTGLIAGLLLMAGAPIVLLFATRKASPPIVAAAILAIDPDLIYYAVECRPYAPMVLVAALQAWSTAARWGIAGLGSATRPRPATRIAFVVSTILLVRLHYVALLLVAAEGIVVLLQSLIDPRRRHERWRSDRRGVDAAIDLGLIALGLLSLLAPLTRIAAHRRDWSRFVTGSAEQTAPLIELAIWGLLVPLTALALERLVSRVVGAFGADRERFAEGSNEAGRTPASPRLFDSIGGACFFGGCAAAAWLLAALATRFGSTPVLLDRYLIGTWGWVAIAAALAVASLRNAWWRPAIALTIVAAWSGNGEARWWFETGRWPGHRIEDWAAATRDLDDSESSELPIVSFAGLIEDARLVEQGNREELEYLKFPLVGLRQPERILPAGSYPQPAWPSGLDERIERTGGIAVVVRDDPSRRELLQRIERELRQRLKRLGGSFAIDERAYGAVFVVEARRNEP